MGLELVVQVVDEMDFLLILLIILLGSRVIEDDLPVVLIPIHLETVKELVEGFIGVPVQLKPSDVHY